MSSFSFIVTKDNRKYKATFVGGQSVEIEEVESLCSQETNSTSITPPEEVVNTSDATVVHDDNDVSDDMEICDSNYPGPAEILFERIHENWMSEQQRILEYKVTHNQKMYHRASEFIKAGYKHQDVMNWLGQNLF